MKLETSPNCTEKKKHSGKIRYQTFSGDMYMNLKPSGHVSKKILTSETSVDANWMVPKYRCEALWMAPWFCWIHPNNTSMDDLTTEKKRLGHTLQKKICLGECDCLMDIVNSPGYLTVEMDGISASSPTSVIREDTHRFRFIHETVDGSENAAPQLRLVVEIPLFTDFLLHPRWWSPNFFHQQYLVIHPSESCWEICWRFLSNFQAIDLNFLVKFPSQQINHFQFPRESLAPFWRLIPILLRLRVLPKGFLEPPNCIEDEGNR